MNHAERSCFANPPGYGKTAARRLLALGSGEPTQAICSSLIAAAFQNVHYPILPVLDRDYRDLHGTNAARREILHIRSSRLFTPRDFDISPYFRIVKPMIERGFDPRHLNWAMPTPNKLQRSPRPRHGNHRSERL